MENKENIEELKNRITILETQVKHLTNDLRVTREENDISMSKYFELYTQMESKVTERTLQLEKAHRVLERKGKELEMMLDLSPAIIFYKDNDLRYQRINKKFTQVIGIPLNEIIGKKYSDLFPENDDYGFHNDLEVLKNGSPLLNKKELFKTSNGQRKFLIDRIPYKDEENKIVGFIGFALDITELESAEKQKRKLEKQLNRVQKMETIGTLAGGVAHDLNNVLSGIVSYPDLLLMNIEDDSPLKRPILAIQKSGEKAAAIVQDLLTLARRGVVSMEVMNLNNIILEHLESIEHAKLKSYHPGVTIDVKLGTDLLNIAGSPVHLSKVIMNLISNAAEAMPDGGIISISTGNRYIDTPMAGYDRVEEGDYVVLSITDNGMGISPEDIDQIFEPFYTKKVMGRSGTGLGMSVIWGTVKDHNGYIDVNSIEGKGTEITIYFPATRSAALQKKSVPDMAYYKGNGERILVVDDIQDQREIVLSMLETLGYSGQAVENGQAAIDYLRDNSADLLLLDMIMDPGIDGLDTYKKVLEQQPFQKAIITSGFSETDRVKEAQTLGAGKYLKKPYTIKKLGEAIREELGKN